MLWILLQKEGTLAVKYPCHSSLPCRQRQRREGNGPSTDEKSSIFCAILIVIWVQLSSKFYKFLPKVAVKTFFEKFISYDLLEEYK